MIFSITVSQFIFTKSYLVQIELILSYVKRAWSVGFTTSKQPALLTGLYKAKNTQTQLSLGAHHSKGLKVKATFKTKTKIMRTSLIDTSTPLWCINQCCVRLYNLLFSAIFTQVNVNTEGVIYFVSMLVCLYHSVDIDDTWHWGKKANLHLSASASVSASVNDQNFVMHSPIWI